MNHTCCEGLVGNIGTGNINGDPKFVGLPNGGTGTGNNRDSYDLHLSAGSPCIDTGNDGDIPHGVDVDLDGVAGINRSVDMGAYEFR